MRAVKEKWMELCEQAAVEQDPDKLFKIVQEINKILQEKEAASNRRSPYDAG